MELKRFTADQAREEYHGEDSFFIRVMNTVYDSIRRKSRNRGRCVVVPCETYKAQFVKRLIRRICSSVSDVPDDATTFSTPAWCIDITSA